MKLFFRGAIVSEEDFAGLNIAEPMPAIGRTQYRVCLQPHGTVVYSSPCRCSAERFVAEVQKALKQGLSCGAEWIDCSGLPGSVETGIVVLRGDE